MNDICEEYPERSGCGRAFVAALAALGFALLLFSLSGCKQMKPVVAVPEIHNQYNGHDRDHSSARSDSIHIRDSVIYRWKHDTLFVDRWHTEFRDRWQHDTLTIKDSIHVNDSVPYTVEVQVPVRVRNGYDRFTSAGFWILAVLIVVVIGIRLWMRFYGLKR